MEGTDLRTDPEFKSLIPPLSPEEYSDLEGLLLDEGCKVAITVWNGVIAEGHNRYEICTKHGISFQIDHERLTNKNRDDVKLWIIKNQFGRRNLSDYQRAQLALQSKYLIAARAKENLKTAEPGVRGGSGCQNSDKAIDTKKELATLAGVSHDTINKVEKIEKAASPELKDLVKNGEISINAAATVIKVQEKISAKNPHTSSESEEWYTPSDIIDAVISTLGVIDLDPCSNSKDYPNVPARNHYTKEDDGLSKAWGGRVFVNPPYGEKIRPWVEKCVQEYQSGGAEELILLVAARTDTKWFDLIGDYPWCGIRGRLSFSESKNNAPFPSAVFYFGENIKAFYESFSQHGRIWRELVKEEADVT
jgi:phage N-6-adenine-methyltransferase